ncbi:3-methyl-2-oxobutanoate hydroxymethyltransferase [Cerasicoccus arenae]|uniref:3-methyl-2-oxobutanoate hydroxymethyltransferase n=1 Tax=Cerasicoccus arenae TaxID=424488 RepID=A0A8J3DJW1_9BACT|nr:3-methyl-2-oxobutanoate hydroxymethyltransferase [Cerasicoccus arenae]MBK1857894.1 3-methyl-2-oxobutanoate hydroxymethyltransferase [Cerasicoccus arenae]GHC09512.1 3-methyl-2-oxobutanoate hydroxymethyltransferase [Cerasicoccus arenae]
MKTTTQTIRQLKGKRPIVVLTAYDFITAQLATEAGVDMILVGDSLGNTALGYESTIPVTVDAMLHHCAAVARAKPSALLMCDVPFAVAGHSTDYLLDVCTRLLQVGGAECVKIEGGKLIAEKCASVAQAGIPVMGHIGLKPQDVLQLGGYRKFGKSAAERQILIDEARAWEQSGAFALLMEMMDFETAAAVTEAISIPTIGIGAGQGTDGQVLVISDALGLNAGKYPGFAKKFVDLRSIAVEALAQYATEVRERKFPE